MTTLEQVQARYDAEQEAMKKAARQLQRHYGDHHCSICKTLIAQYQTANGTATRYYCNEHAADRKA